MSSNVTFDSALPAVWLELLIACGSAWWFQEVFSHTRDLGCARGDGRAVTQGGCRAGWWLSRPLHKQIPSWLGDRGNTASLGSGLDILAGRSMFWAQGQWGAPDPHAPPHPSCVAWARLSHQKSLRSLLLNGHGGACCQWGHWYSTSEIWGERKVVDKEGAGSFV